jgi:hypothetical protein
LVPENALLLTNPINSRLVGNPENYPETGFVEISSKPISG